MRKKHKSTRQNHHQPERMEVLLPIPGPTRRLGRGLLDQQMWCLGCDIRRSAGNLLLAYGFTRYRSSENQSGGSSYTFPLKPGGSIGLWGFGLFYGEVGVGGLFLKRYQFAPKLVEQVIPPQTITQPSQFPTGHRPRTPAEADAAQHLLATALTWLSDYEQWVQTQAGPAYRAQSLQRWHRRAVVPAGEMATAWQELAEQFTPVGESTFTGNRMKT